MKLALFVHDLYLEIGHSNALIETVNNLPEKIDELIVVAFTSDNLEKLFPNLNCKKKLIRVPFPRIYPFIFKMFFYQIYAGIISFLMKGNYKRIGIGLACLNIDIVNIQFVHKHWSEFYFNYLKKGSLKYYYKKILFFFFNSFEKIMYANKTLKVSSLSQFTTEYLLKNFTLSPSNVVTNYSGINLEKFNIVAQDRHSLYLDLAAKYPSLNKIDPSLPIYLFVGAFERKGLDIILQKFKQLKGANLVIIGKSESSNNYDFSSEYNIAHITFTKELPKFYSLCDCFVFASVYEPFGLVILEAAAMGMNLCVTTDNVGACELLTELDGIKLFKNWNDFQITQNEILLPEKRVSQRNERLDIFNKYTWQKTGERFYKLLDND